MPNKLRTSIRDYLKHRSSDRVLVKHELDSLVASLPGTAIFGGMLREFALGNARRFLSDIDLVTLAPQRDLAKAIEHLSPVRNKFGGFRFVIAKQLFDIWAFDDTWAFKQGLVKGTNIDDLLKTTFFNLDSSLLQLSGGNTFLQSDECRSGIENRVLEISLAENPYPDRMVQRAIRLSFESHLTIGPSLANYMVKHGRLCKPNWLNQAFLRELNEHLDSGSVRNFIYNPQRSLFP